MVYNVGMAQYEATDKDGNKTTILQKHPFYHSFQKWFWIGVGFVIVISATADRPYTVIPVLAVLGFLYWYGKKLQRAKNDNTKPQV